MFMFKVSYFPVVSGYVELGMLIWCQGIILLPKDVHIVISDTPCHSFQEESIVLAEPPLCAISCQFVTFLRVIM